MNGANVFILDRTGPLVAIVTVDRDGFCRGCSASSLALIHDRIDYGVRLPGLDLNQWFGPAALWDAVRGGALKFKSATHESNRLLVLRSRRK